MTAYQDICKLSHLMLTKGLTANPELFKNESTIVR